MEKCVLYQTNTKGLYDIFKDISVLSLDIEFLNFEEKREALLQLRDSIKSLESMDYGIKTEENIQIFAKKTPVLYKLENYMVENTTELIQTVNFIEPGNQVVNINENDSAEYSFKLSNDQRTTASTTSETPFSDRNVPCNLCYKKFTSEKDLNRHQKTVHIPDDQKPFQCNLCGKGFKWSKQLEDHTNTHTGNKPYKCEICLSAFQNGSNLRSHKRKKHGLQKQKQTKAHYYDELDNPNSMLSDKKPHKCRYCPISFANTSNRNAHEKKRHQNSLMN